MKTNKHTKSQGFTLIETTVVLLLALLISAAALGLLTNQIRVFDLLRRQDFMVNEAPQINNTLHRIMSNASSFQLFASKADAFAGTNPVTANASAILLEYQGASRDSGTSTANRMAQTIRITFNQTTTPSQLEFYLTDPAAVPVKNPNAGDPPDWIITDNASDVSFGILTGVFQTTITGPNGGVITYSNTTLK